MVRAEVGGSRSRRVRVEVEDRNGRAMLGEEPRRRLA
jgi:hypothetical protein